MGLLPPPAGGEHTAGPVIFDQVQVEVLDGFDNEYCLSVSFCKLISLEDFKEQSLSCIQQCLHELYSNMEQNPRICKRALRKQKRRRKKLV